MALLNVDKLSVHFGDESAPFRAVDRISYSVKQGEVVGIVGESGSGKSVSSLAIMGLIDYPGRVLFNDSLDKLRYIAEMIVEGIAVDAAFSCDLPHRYPRSALLLKKAEKGLYNLLPGEISHMGIISQQHMHCRSSPFRGMHHSAAGRLAQLAVPSHSGKHYMEYRRNHESIGNAILQEARIINKVICTRITKSIKQFPNIYNLARHK